ncbi:NAD-dependent epimerase/dehydratase family protein [Chloroflexota bacterium]
MGFKIGITGGAGYIGSMLARRLREAAFEVRIIDNFSYSSKDVVEDLKDIGVDIIEGDVLNDKDLDRFLDGVGFIYHLASIANIAECSKDIEKSCRLNVFSTYFLLDKIKNNSNIKGFFFSSAIAAIYGEPDYSPVDEEHPVKVIHDYGVLKRSSELFCQSYYRRYGTPIVIGRQSNVYGPSPMLKVDSAVHAFINQVANGNNITIFGSGEQRRNFIFIHDLIDAYHQVLNKAQTGNNIFGEIYNLAGEEATIKDVAETVIQLGNTILDKKVQVEYREGRKEALSTDLKVSIEKAKRVLGWEPKYSLDEGIKATFDYICQRRD